MYGNSIIDGHLLQELPYGDVCSWSGCGRGPLLGDPSSSLSARAPPAIPGLAK